MEACLDGQIVAAAEHGDVSQVLQLYDRDAYGILDARSRFQSTLLHIAAKCGHADLCRTLLSAGLCDVHAVDFGGMRRTALHWAIHEKHIHVIEVLMDAGADPKVRR
jgi:ankyrin repeat protein